MSYSVFYLVSDDAKIIHDAREFWKPKGVSVKVFSPLEWNRGLDTEEFCYQVKIGVPSLALGSSPLNEEAKVLQFKPLKSSDDLRVRTINQLECVAIEEAIYEFRGNLTEAAKALGIGRATLYRKVKQYEIDHTQARRRRAA